MTVALLGNTNPQMQVMQPDGTKVLQPAEHINQSVTRVKFWDGVTDPEFVEHALSTDNDRMLVMIARELGKDLRRHAVAVLEAEQIMGVHAGGDAPPWVFSEDERLAAAIAKHFGCPVGEPTALLTTAGRDALHAQHAGTAAQPAAFIYMAVSESTAAPSAASTVLPGEITTAGGGLLRAQSTVAHTTGTNTTTLTKTFAANGADVLPKVIAKLGVLNAAAAGILAYEALLNATATLTIPGDSTTVTETLTAG